MTNRLMNGVVIACGLMLLASAAWADKAEVEKKAQETKVTLSLKAVAVGEALDWISRLGDIVIQKTDIPTDAPKVTIELKDVSVSECLQFVTTLAGLTYVITDDGIEVSGRKAGTDAKTQTPNAKDPAGD